MFQMSPGVLVTEKDYTDIVPAVSSSVGATVGVYPWGPVLTPLLLDSETTLISRFGLPNDSNFQYFYTAANFLAYTDSLYVTRARTAGQRNAISMPSGGLIVNGSITGGSEYIGTPTLTIDPPQVVASVNPYKVVNVVTVGTGGTGYTVAPLVTFSAPPVGIRATGFATVSGGVVTGITLTNRGSGYTATAPTITFTTVNGGTNAAATCTVMDAVGGTAASATLTTSYVVDSINAGEAGTNHTLAPTVAFAAPNAGGVTATGFATIDENGAVTGITITNRGSGYDAPDVEITLTRIGGT